MQFGFDKSKERPRESVCYQIKNKPGNKKNMQGMKKTKQQQQLSRIDSKKKERHIVTWSQEEDDILREQISIHSTENWAIIASKFKDKTTRQCRRRWYTYLNSDFKKGGWSPEEDLLLCEVQKIFGNRWTEIAKVVSGRTDNAVKNRFSTLCKKRAKYEALAKENSSSCMNSNNKRVNIPSDLGADGISVIESPRKKLRTHISGSIENVYFLQQSRAPFSVLADNDDTLNSLSVQQDHVGGTKVINGEEDLEFEKLFSNFVSNPSAVQHNKIQGTFLKNDDPKITALMQQAELPTSLDQKDYAENTDQSLENTWKVLHEFLNQNKETDTIKCKIPEMHLDDFKEIIEDLRSSNDGSTFSWRQPDLYEDSPGSSEYSTGSIVLPQSAGDPLQHSLHQYTATNIRTPDIGEQKRNEEGEKGAHTGENTLQEAGIFSSFDDKLDIEEALCTPLSADFSSPLQVSPLFRFLAAGIPSPKFSESERNFLIRTLGIESPCSNSNNNTSQQPPCKRALLQSL